MWYFLPWGAPQALKIPFGLHLYIRAKGFGQVFHVWAAGRLGLWRLLGCVCAVGLLRPLLSRAEFRRETQTLSQEGAWLLGWWLQAEWHKIETSGVGRGGYETNCSCWRPTCTSSPLPAWWGRGGQLGHTAAAPAPLTTKGLHENLVCFQKRHLPCSCCLFPCVSGLSQGCDSPFLLGRAFFHNHCVAICVLLLWEGSRWVQETAKPRGLWVELLYGGISVCSEIVKENKWIFWQWRQMTAERSALVNSVSKEWVINVKTAPRWWCLKFLSDVCRTSILVDCVHSGPRALEKHWAVFPCWVPLLRHEQG